MRVSKMIMRVALSESWPALTLYAFRQRLDAAFAVSNQEQPAEVRDADADADADADDEDRG